MKNTLIITIFSWLLCSCSEDKSKVLNMETSENKAHMPGLVDYSKIPKVEIVEKIDVLILQAVKEGWSKDEWVQRFGVPRRANSYKDDLEFIQYYSSGPFEDASKQLVTGITIKLRKDKTFDYSYRTTSFGLPEYAK